MPKWAVKAIKITTFIATIGSFIPGPIGMACTAVAVAGNLAQGNWKGAALAAAGGAFGALRLITKAAAIAKVAQATAEDGNAGFGTLKASSFTARLAGKLYIRGSKGL